MDVYAAGVGSDGYNFLVHPIALGNHYNYKLKLMHQRNHMN